MKLKDYETVESILRRPYEVQVKSPRAVGFGTIPGAWFATRDEADAQAAKSRGHYPDSKVRVIDRRA